MRDLRRLSAAVQRNCHISDARHARDYTLCVYLLKMREYFRWEKGFGLTQVWSQGDLSDWIVQRERLWDRLEPEDFECLPIGEACHQPFDTESVNRQLVPAGLVYSAGYGRFVKPHFFLGRLLRKETIEDFQVFVSTHEYARDLIAPPAMSQGGNIFVRRDSLRRMLWERVEDWSWRKRSGNPMARVIASYGFDEDPEQALEQMTDRELKAVVLHELGEGAAGRVLGNHWAEMMLAVASSRAELQARAVRDLLADCLVTLPDLLDRNVEPSIHFFFGNFRGMRRHLFPLLVDSYDHWSSTGNKSLLRDAVSQGQSHWRAVGDGILGRYRELGEECVPAIDDYLHAQILA